MTKSSNDFYTIFSKELDECKVEFERHLAKKGLSWRRETVKWLAKQIRIGYEDFGVKFDSKAVVAAEDQAIDLINLLLMFIQQSKKSRESA